MNQLNINYNILTMRSMHFFAIFFSINSASAQFSWIMQLSNFLQFFFFSFLKYIFFRLFSTIVYVRIPFRRIRFDSSTWKNVWEVWPKGWQNEIRNIQINKNNNYNKKKAQTQLSAVKKKSIAINRSQALLANNTF